MASKTDKPESKSKIIKPTKLAIAGAGGIGGFVASGIFNYGAIRNQFDYAGMTVDIFDDDIVDASNLLHQNYTEDDIGQYKAKLCADRYAMNPMLRFMEQKDFKNYEVIFSCVDSMKFRTDLYKYGFDHPELFWIDGRCSSRNVGLYNSRCSRKSLEVSLNNSEERQGCLLAVDKKNKVSHATPQVIAAMVLQTFLNYIRGEVQTDKLEIMI
jgi:molybdopterin/thiamine biosynthesis adenylyltransferase